MNTNKTRNVLLRLVFVLAALSMAGACSNGGAPRAYGVAPIQGTGITHNPLNPNDWRTVNARQTAHATAAVIVDAREIHARSVSSVGTNNIGSAIGAGLGGLAGNQFGGGTGKLLSTIGGALLGGLAGNMAGQAISHEVAVEYIVRTNNGQALSIVQGGQLPLPVGAQVWVIGRGSERSIVPRA